MTYDMNAGSKMGSVWLMHNILRACLGCMACVLLLGMSFDVRAGCTIEPSSATVRIDEVIGRDLGVGSSLSPDWHRAPISFIKCKTWVIQQDLKLWVKSSRSYYLDTWNLANPGLSVHADLSWGGRAISNFMTSNSQESEVSSVSPGDTIASIRLSLIKSSSALSASQINEPQLFTMWTTNQEGKDKSNVFTLHLIGSVSTRSCAVDASTQRSVEMAEVSSRKFTAINDTAGATPFNIIINCAVPTAVYGSFSDASTPANKSNILSLSNNATAEGVGLQILQGTKALFYGPSTTTPSAYAKWNAGKITGNKQIIPFAVQYIATQNSVRGGSVEGKVTYTMSYP